MCPKLRQEAGKADTVRIIGYRHQRTLAADTVIEGVGFVTGARVRVRFRSAPADTGIPGRGTVSWDSVKGGPSWAAC